MRIRLLSILILSISLLTSGCVYQAALSQGNLLDQEDIDLVEVGMTRGQVRFLLGTPVVEDPFHRDRWDYIYYFRQGRKRAIDRRWMIVVFEDDRVSEIRTDVPVEPT